MKRMNNLKNVIAARIMGGLVIGMTAVAGVAPVTVFAQSQEAECICEEKCSQDSINEECAVCLYDYNVCQGVDAHVEGSEECTETAEESYGPLTPDGNMNMAPLRQMASSSLRLQPSPAIISILSLTVTIREQRPCIS